MKPEFPSFAPGGVSPHCRWKSVCKKKSEAGKNWNATVSIFVKYYAHDIETTLQNRTR
jgi:hypothetical protein